MAPIPVFPWWFFVLLFGVPILVIAGIIYLVAWLVSRYLMHKSLAKKWFFAALVPATIATLFLLQML